MAIKMLYSLRPMFYGHFICLKSYDQKWCMGEMTIDQIIEITDCIAMHIKPSECEHILRSTYTPFVIGNPWQRDYNKSENMRSLLARDTKATHN